LFCYANMERNEAMKSAARAVSLLLSLAVPILMGLGVVLPSRAWGGMLILAGAALAASVFLPDREASKAV
jgi:hypothetical protein